MALADVRQAAADDTCGLCTTAMHLPSAPRGHEVPGLTGLNRATHRRGHCSSHVDEQRPRERSATAAVAGIQTGADSKRHHRTITQTVTLTRQCALGRSTRREQAQVLKILAQVEAILRDA